MHAAIRYTDWSPFHWWCDDVIKWKHFPRYWPFVRGIHRWPLNSPHKGQWRGTLIFSLIWAWINGWVNNREADDLRHPRAHYDVIVMDISIVIQIKRSVRFDLGQFLAMRSPQNFAHAIMAVLSRYVQTFITITISEFRLANLNYHRIWITM